MEKVTIAIIFQHKKIKGNLWQLIPKEPIIGKTVSIKKDDIDVLCLSKDNNFYEFVDRIGCFNDSVGYPLILGNDEIENITHFYFKDIAKDKYFEMVDKNGQKFFYKVTDNNYLLTTNMLSFYGDENDEYIGNVIYNKNNKLDIKYLFDILKLTIVNTKQIPKNEDKAIDTVRFEVKGDGANVIQPVKESNDKIVDKSPLSRREKYNAILNVRKAYNELKQVIISQDQALKDVLLTIRSNIEKADENYKINNILLIGPTGVGKTLIAQEVAKILKLPFASIDSNNYTPTGYVGGNITECLESLYMKASGDLELAQKGIVFIDEIDKLAIGDSQDYARTVGVQDALLTMVEGQSYNLTIGKDKTVVPFNTSKVTFIAAGAFANITSPKLQNSIGFNSKVVKSPDYKSDINKKLINYGMKGELVGRFIKVLLNALTMEDVIKIILSKASIFNFYLELFSDYNIQFEYNMNFIEALAKYSMDKNGGARGINQAIEEVFCEYLWQIYDSDNEFSKLIVNEEIVSNHKNFILK